MMRLSKNLIFAALIALSSIATVQACDMSAFEQTEFSDRCQRLIDYCNKAFIAMSAQHPDTDARLSEVSKDWIDFYLSHGNSNVQPPNMSIVPAEIWNNKLNGLGKSFSDFIHKKISAKDYQKVVLQISLMKNEDLLTNLHNSFNAAELCETDASKIENWTLWLDCRFYSPATILYSYVEELPELVSELKMEMEDYRDSLERFTEITKDAPKELKQSFFDNLNRSIGESLSKWEALCLYK